MTSAITLSVLILAISFNAILSVINGHIVALSRIHVILGELAVYAAALTIVALNADRKMMPWFLLAVFIVIDGLLLSLGNETFNAKYIRDVLVIPTFIMLGMTYRSTTPLRPLIIIQTIILFISVLEATSPNGYSEIFKVLNYYVNTRDFSANQFWNGDSNLFVSATRPGERFFSFIDLHRLSSIYLEPVTLGNYCAVAVILLIAFWHEVEFRAKCYLVISTLAILVGCDGRLAAVSILIILFAEFFLWKVSSRWSVLFLPIILLFSAVLVWNFNLDATQDNFGGRLASSVSTLSQIDLAGIFGFNAQLADRAPDSGIAYFILTQSVVGVIVIWLTICLGPAGTLPGMRIYLHGIALFIPLNLMVSYSFFSLKIASLIWFYYGYFYMRELSSSGLSHSEDKALARAATGAA